MRFHNLTVSVLFFFLAGCMTPKKSGNEIAQERQRRAAAERRVASMKKEVLELKTENGILMTALEKQKGEEAVDLGAVPNELTATADPVKQNESLLYQKIVDAYKGKDDRGLASMEALLRKAFPKSSYLDDSIYLKGLLAYHLGRHTEALEIFDQVIQNYPRSNRWKDSHLAKAMVYKKLNLPDQARTVLQSLNSIRKNKGTSAHWDESTVIISK